MKYEHCIDEDKHRQVWIWSNRIGSILLIAFIFFLCGYLLFLASDHSSNYYEYFGVVLSIGFVDLGLLDLTWRNERYSISETAIMIKNAIYEKKIKKEEIKAWSIIPVKLTKFGKAKEYIVLNLTSRKFTAPLDLTYCSINRKNMIIIRYTPTRLNELSMFLNRDYSSTGDGSTSTEDGSMC